MPLSELILTERFGVTYYLAKMSRQQIFWHYFIIKIYNVSSAISFRYIAEWLISGESVLVRVQVWNQFHNKPIPGANFCNHFLEKLNMYIHIIHTPKLHTKCITVNMLIKDCGCPVTWFCYQLIAKPGNKTAAVSWPDPHTIGISLEWQKL